MLRHIILPLVLAATFTGCLTYYPNLTPVPLVAHEGEAHGAAFVTMSGAEGYAAYGLADGYALMAAGALGFNYSAPAGIGSSIEAHNFGELDFGRHWMINDRFSLESFLGAGIGFSDWYSGDSRSVGRYIRSNLQGCAAYHADHFELAAGARASLVHFYQFDDPSFGARDAFFVEPFGVLRTGWDLVKIEGEIGFPLQPFASAAFGHPRMTGGIGLHVILPDLNNAR